MVMRVFQLGRKRGMSYVFGKLSIYDMKHTPSDFSIANLVVTIENFSITTRLVI
jgi:hypothetical protein